MLCRKTLEAQFKNKLKLTFRFPFGSVKCWVLSVKCSKQEKLLSSLDSARDDKGKLEFKKMPLSGRAPASFAGETLQGQTTMQITRSLNKLSPSFYRNSLQHWVLQRFLILLVTLQNGWGRVDSQTFIFCIHHSTLQLCPALILSAKLIHKHSTMR